MEGISVECMESSRGNKVPNQFKIWTPEAVYFQSYNTVIAMKKDGKIYLDRDKWNCSKTTGKYRNAFLGLTLAKTRQMIESGEIELVNLNK